MTLVPGSLSAALMAGVTLFQILSAQPARSVETACSSAPGSRCFESRKAGIDGHVDESGDPDDPTLIVLPVDGADIADIGLLPPRLTRNFHILAPAIARRGSRKAANANTGLTTGRIGGLLLRQRNSRVAILTPASRFALAAELVERFPDKVAGLIVAAAPQPDQRLRDIWRAPLDTYWQDQPADERVIEHVALTLQDGKRQFTVAIRDVQTSGAGVLSHAQFLADGADKTVFEADDLLRSGSRQAGARSLQALHETSRVPILVYWQTASRRQEGPGHTPAALPVPVSLAPEPKRSSGNEDTMVLVSRKIAAFLDRVLSNQGPSGAQ